MMGKIVKKIISYRKVVLIFFSVFAIVGVILNFMVKVNYNITDYLPKESKSTIALDIMKEEFEQNTPNARVMINDVSIL